MAREGIVGKWRFPVLLLLVLPVDKYSIEMHHSEFCQQPHVIDKGGDGTGGEGSARETKKINLVADSIIGCLVVVRCDESIRFTDMLCKSETGGTAENSILEVTGTDSGLVVGNLLYRL